MSSYMDGPQMLSSDFEDALMHISTAFHSYFSTSKESCELQIELGRQTVTERMRDALAAQENRMNQLIMDLQAERNRAERAESSHQRTTDRCSVGINRQERRNEENEREIERLLADLYKARRNLPSKREHDEGTHNVLLEVKVVVWISNPPESTPPLSQSEEWYRIRSSL